MSDASLTPSLGGLLQEFFLQRLIAQRDASPATVASYRDTFRLLLRYAHDQLKLEPTELSITDLDAPLVLSFLEHLEHERGNSARTRNARFAAIRSFLKFALVKTPMSLPSIQRVLAIPMKRFDRPVLGFLSREEIAAILNAPSSTTWSGRRDHALLSTMYNTGARVSEVLNTVVNDASTSRRKCILLHGKGRKERVVPLWKGTCRLLAAWIRYANLPLEAPLFPNRRGEKMSRSGIEHRLKRAVVTAESTYPNLRERPVSPHTIRHTTAMHLLQSGVDITVIALWLGHENPATTHMYLEADLEMKKRALDKIQQPSSETSRFKPTDAVLAFLDGL